MGASCETISTMRGNTSNGPSWVFDEPNTTFAVVRCQKKRVHLEFMRIEVQAVNYNTEVGGRSPTDTCGFGCVHYIQMCAGIEGGNKCRVKKYSANVMALAGLEVNIERLETKEFW